MSTSSQACWTIGELAMKAGVSVRALRHYEEIGLLAPDRSEGGHRRYAPADLAELRRIVALRRLGLGLRQIAALTDAEDPELLRRLAERRLEEVELTLRIEQRIRQRLQALLASLGGSGGLPGEISVDEGEEDEVGIALTRIYTGLGDGGETQLADLRRVSKNDPHIEAGGALDELGAQLAQLLAVADLPERERRWLERIENDLFDLGSDLAWPSDGDEPRPRIGAEYADWLETICDEANDGLQPLDGFVLPGRTVIAAQVATCSAVCRRAERRVFAVEGANPQIARYLNRLSDLFFILGRVVDEGAERLWRPGAGREVE